MCIVHTPRLPVCGEQGHLPRKGNSGCLRPVGVLRRGAGATSELGDTSRPDCGGNALGVTADLAHVSDAVSFAWRMVPSLGVQVDGLPLRVALASGPLLLVRLGKWGAWPVYTRV